MKKIAIANWDKLQDRTPIHALVADVDLVIVRYDDAISVLYGRCAQELTRNRSVARTKSIVGGKNRRNSRMNWMSS